MAKTRKEQKTVSYYDQQAQQWALEHGGQEEKSYWKKQMTKFKELLPSGKILEIGSGAGKDAKALVAMGYEYTGTDASKGLIEVAQVKNPNAKFVNQAVEDLNFPSGSFDGFWTAATLLHIPKDQIDLSLQKIKSVCKVGSIGFISLKEGQGEKEDTNTGRWFAYYSEEEFRDVLNRNGFEVVDFEIREETRPDQPNWLAFFVKQE